MDGLFYDLIIYQRLAFCYRTQTHCLTLQSSPTDIRLSGGLRGNIIRTVLYCIVYYTTPALTHNHKHANISSTYQLTRYSSTKSNCVDRDAKILIHSSSCFTHVDPVVSQSSHPVTPRTLAALQCSKSAKNRRSN